MCVLEAEKKGRVRIHVNSAFCLLRNGLRDGAFPEQPNICSLKRAAVVWESARCVGEQTNFPPSLIRNFSREVSLLVAQPEAFFHSQDLITVPACIGVASNFQLGDEQENTVEAPAVWIRSQGRWAPCPSSCRSSASIWM